MTRKLKEELPENFDKKMISLTLRETEEVNRSQPEKAKITVCISINKLYSKNVYNHKFYKPISKL